MLGMHVLAELSDLEKRVRGVLPRTSVREGADPIAARAKPGAQLPDSDACVPSGARKCAGRQVLVPAACL